MLTPPALQPVRTDRLRKKPSVQIQLERTRAPEITMRMTEITLEMFRLSTVRARSCLTIFPAHGVASAAASALLALLLAALRP